MSTSVRADNSHTLYLALRDLCPYTLLLLIPPLPICFFSNTGYLNLYQNQLHGTLPNNLGLRSLSYLDLGHNDFSGPIPEDWCTGHDSFRRLRHLHLDHNRFNGSLPQDFTQIGGGRLNQLTVQNNELTGVVPGDWDPITMLVTLEVQNNEFSGFGKNLCKLSVFHSGELASLRSPCDICSCGQPFCDQSICTPS